MIDRAKYGPWALILGASEGVGVAFARQLGQAGIKMVLVARQQALLHALSLRVRAETGTETRTLTLDLTRSDMLDQAAETMRDIMLGATVIGGQE